MVAPIAMPATLSAAAMKPISTIAKALRTVALSTYEPSRAFRERADSCAVPAAAGAGTQPGDRPAGAAVFGAERVGDDAVLADAVETERRTGR